MKRHDDSISDRLRRMAATDELSVGRGRAEQIASRAMARASSRPRLRSLVAAVAGSAFAIVSVTGLGAIADSAVPGDSLYPVDRAYEALAQVIGRDADRTQETLEEAIALAQRGNRDHAAQHIAAELGRLLTPEEDVQVPPTSVQTVEIEPVPEAVEQVEESPPTTVATEADEATAAAEAVEPPSEPAPAPTPVEDAAEAPVEEEGDPFLLALENALRATQAAAGTTDELISAEADEAVRSVVKLAADATEEGSGTITDQVAPTALSTSETTTTISTTTTTTAPGKSGEAPGNSTSTTTTTSVPIDSEEEPPGDGDTAGDDTGGSQEGSGHAEEPGDDGDTSPGPIILPIP